MNQLNEQEEEQPANLTSLTNFNIADTSVILNDPSVIPPPLTPPISSSGKDNNDEIIHSPLDQRAYKSLTLSNGIRVMLISTYDVEIFPEEVDATKVPCQVPEVAEFNKTYLGYDNPAARVKCACPCDEKKTCCCNSAKAAASTLSEKVCKNTLEDIDTIKAACCSTQAAGQSTTKETVPEKPAVKTFRHEVTSVSHNFNAYKLKIFNELKKREAAIANAKRLAHASAPESHLIRKIDNQEEVNATNQTLQLEAISQEFATDTNVKRVRNTSLRNYPFPPRYSEGLHSKRSTCPIDNTREKSNKQSFSNEFSPDLEGNVYLVIGSGYFDDPDDQPGLAHFCEHAVFLGSSKFPEPNQMFKLVLPYNGNVNAYTSGMMTTFTISSAYLLFPLAVEMLGDMVGFPLFPNALVAAELEALDSEYSLRQDDTPKYFQLIGSLAKKGHVMRKMDSGNINTLTVPNFYRKLVEWRKIYYNPSRMTLAVEAPFPLDFMESLVVESFGKIPHHHTPPIPLMLNRQLMSNSPFDMKRFHQIYQVPSVYHSEFIALHWGLDSKAWKNLKVKPLEYLGAIIAHRADGGLFHYLSTQGLATNVDAGCWESDVTRNHFTSVFSICIDMTDKGFKRQDNILQAIFGYIDMLIAQRPHKSFFQELQKQQLDSFHYLAAESSQPTAECISTWMQFIPPKWCVISPSLMAEFDEQLIQKYTENLTIETANVIIFSKNYQGMKDSRTMEEFYNTPYAAYNFPDELTEKINKTKEEYAKYFTLPPPNPLLLNNACSRARDKDLLKKGSLTKVKGKLSVSFVSRNVKHVRGLLPQARYSIWIGSPVSTYHGAAEGSSTKMLIFSQYLNELIQSKFYHASTADVQLETEICQGELHINFAGPSPMLPPLLEKFFDLFKNFENIADQVGFEVVRSAFIETLDNTILDNRFLAWDLFYYLWTNNHELIFDHKKYAEKMNFSTFIAFVKAFKIKMYIQVHTYGYVSKAQGLKIVDLMKSLEYSPIELRQYLLYRCLKLPLGERIIKVSSQNPNVHTSVVINSYQFGMMTDAEEEAVNFFAKTMSDAAFYQLRTEQQLGYIIIIYAEITYGVSSIVVELVTQPKNFSTDYCNACIDKFLLDFYKENLSTPEAYMEFCLGKPKLDLPYITVKTLFSSHLLPNPFTYKKLSVQVVGELQDVSKSSEKDGQMQSTYRKIIHSHQHFETDLSQHTHNAGTLGKTSIAHVRAARKLLLQSKSKETGNLHNRSLSSNDSTVSVKMVRDFAKFKHSLAYYT